MNKYVKITEDSGKEQEIWLPCILCRVETAHRVFFSANSDGELGDGQFLYQWNEKHQIIQCQGWRTLSFRHESSNSEDYTQSSDDDYEVEIKEELYPPRYKRRLPLEDADYLPYKVHAIYKETYFTLCAHKPILAGIGIRALVESVCRERKATGTLEKMIEHLVSSNYLRRQEADILHKLRFMGNDAAHEAKPHKQRILDAAFDVIEHLLINVYLLEERARGLPDKTTKKKSP